jgi:hypothetical protein
MNPAKISAIIFKPNLAYFTSILQKIGSKGMQDTCPTTLHTYINVCIDRKQQKIKMCKLQIFVITNIYKYL